MGTHNSRTRRGYHSVLRQVIHAIDVCSSRPAAAAGSWRTVFRNNNLGREPPRPHHHTACASRAQYLVRLRNQTGSVAILKRGHMAALSCILTEFLRRNPPSITLIKLYCQCLYNTTGTCNTRKHILLLCSAGPFVCGDTLHKLHAFFCYLILRRFIVQFMSSVLLTVRSSYGKREGKPTGYIASFLSPATSFSKNACVATGSDVFQKMSIYENRKFHCTLYLIR